MSQSKAQIRDQVGLKCGIIATGQQLQEYDKNIIDQAYYEVYEELKEDALNFWSISGDIPNKFVPYVVALICENVNSTFSIPKERYARIKPVADRAKFKISKLGAQNYETTSRPVYY